MRARHDDDATRRSTPRATAASQRVSTFQARANKPYRQRHICVAASYICMRIETSCRSSTITLNSNGYDSNIVAVI